MLDCTFLMELICKDDVEGTQKLNSYLRLTSSGDTQKEMKEAIGTLK